MLFEPTIALQRKHPNLRFDLSSSSFERMVQSLLAGSVDVAVGFAGAFAEWPELHLEPIPALNTTLFARNGHPILEHKIASPDMLVAYDLVLPSGLRPHGVAFQALYEHHGIDWRRRVHIVDYFPITKEIVLKSNALAVAPSDYVATARMKRLFTSVRVDGFSIDFSTPMCCATRARWRQTPAVREFIITTRKSTTKR
ncbi:MAG: substrate-binding domain-containing protein [Hyphomonadaceae bacterium]|nr:substrate-binding domain-containing protein [Hyphomonadaceae bacterium]